MTVILPMMAILSVTSEWSQRSGLTTFTLVPHRGRVIGAKVVATVVVGVTSMVVAMAIGALGNIVGTAITGVATRVGRSRCSTWLLIVLANVLGMLIGFMLGRADPQLGRRDRRLLRVLVRAADPLGPARRERQPGGTTPSPGWTSTSPRARCSTVSMAAKDWAHLATASGIWLVIPLAVGLALVMRSEVK